MTYDVAARKIHLDISDDGAVITISSSAMDKDLIKLVPGTRWDPDLSVWTVRATWASCMALKGIIGDRLVVSDKIKTFAADLLSKYIAPQRELREMMTPPPGWEIEFDKIKNDTYSPLPYQPAGALFLAPDGGNCLFDPMGTGKTAQTIMAIRLRQNRGIDPFPLLIVAPNSVKDVWMTNFATWAPDIRVVDAGNHAKARKTAVDAILAHKADVMIVNWEALPRNSRLAPYGGTALTINEKKPQLFNSVKWVGVVGDELHKGKNPNAKQTRAIWALAHDKNVTWRKGLTGTPIANTPADLWSALHFCDPNEFPSKTKWLDRYCLLGFGTWGGMEVIGIKPETRTEFDHTTEHYWRRVPKEIALPDLPPKVHVRRIVQMTPSQKKQYEAMVERQIVEFAESELVAINPLAKMTRLLQFASATCDLVEGVVTMTDPSCKVDELMNVLEEVEGQVIVFAQSRKLIELASRRLDAAKISYGMITGRISVPERNISRDKFQAGKLRVMLCTIKAGGLGITLTAADTVVFMQREFASIANEQAEDRAHRIGSEIHESILIVDILSEGTVDFRVHELANMKHEQLQSLVQDKERLRAMLLGKAA